MAPLYHVFVSFAETGAKRQKRPFKPPQKPNLFHPSNQVDRARTGQKITDIDGITAITTSGARILLDETTAVDGAELAIGSSQLASVSADLSLPSGYFNEFSSNGVALYFETNSVQNIASVEAVVVLSSGAKVTISSK